MRVYLQHSLLCRVFPNAVPMKGKNIMDNNNLNQNDEILEPMSAEDYVNQLAAMRETTVSKQEYNRICKENRQLAAALTNGGSIAQQQKEPVNLKELRNKVLTDKKRTDLDYFSDVIKLRDASIEQTGIDPFLPANSKYKPNEADVANANKVAETIKNCIEKSDGNPKKFTLALQSHCL